MGCREGEVAGKADVRGCMSSKWCEQCTHKDQAQSTRAATQQGQALERCPRLHECSTAPCAALLAYEAHTHPPSNGEHLLPHTQRTRLTEDDGFELLGWGIHAHLMSASGKKGSELRGTAGEADGRQGSRYASRVQQTCAQPD